MLTIDASVFVAAARSVEKFHFASLTMISRLVSDAIALYSPCFALTEIAAALARTTGDSTLITITLRQLEALHGLVLVDLTNDRARHAASLATSYHLRGADSVYLQTSVEFATTLITWDNEMLARAPAVVPSMTPTDWLAANPV